MEVEKENEAEVDERTRKNRTSANAAVVDGCSAMPTRPIIYPAARSARVPRTTVRPGCRMVCYARVRRRDVNGRTPTMLSTGESGYAIVFIADSLTISYLARPQV